MGSIGQTPRMEYTATAFAEPLRRVFAELYRPTKELTIDFHPESKYFVQSIEYQSEITPWFDHLLYRPFLESATFVAQQVRRLQVRLIASVSHVYRPCAGAAYWSSQGGFNMVGISPRSCVRRCWRWRWRRGLVGFVRWMKARLQNRRGAPPWQPYFELRKLFGKEVVMSEQCLVVVSLRALYRLCQHAGGRRC